MSKTTDERLRRAWVIGGSRGLGRATAAELLAKGAEVTVSSRRGERLERAVAELRSTGPATALPLDLSEPGAVGVAIEAVEAAGGALDVAVLSGGGPPSTSVAGLGVEGLEGAFRSLLVPAYELVAGLGERMRERGHGVIVIVTSSSVLEPLPNMVASNAMRSAVTSLAKTAAAELAPDGVRVLCVAPGRIATDRVAELDSLVAEREGKSIEEVEAGSQGGIPMGRYGDPAEFGRVVAFLCSPDASYMTGTTVRVDGGKISDLLN
jgi:3-oxoacyl-[acyl-carrier protein] reductase